MVGWSDTTIKYVAVGVAASVTYGGIIVVLLWMNGARMVMTMTTSTPTKFWAWGERGSNTTMSTMMRLGAGVNTTIRCMKGDDKTWRCRTNTTITRLRVGGKHMA